MKVPGMEYCTVRVVIHHEYLRRLEAVFPFHSHYHAIWPLQFHCVVEFCDNILVRFPISGTLGPQEDLQPR
jgi:hypothetical protein